jgi:ATP-binding cassette, subfamily B, bacterial
MKKVIESFGILLWLTKKMTKRSKVLICLASIVSMSGGFITSMIPKTIGKLLDLYMDQNAVVVTLLFLAFLYLLNESVLVIRRLIVERIATTFSCNLTMQAAEKILRLEMDFIQTQRSGGLNSKVQSSVNGSMKLVKLFFMDLIPSFFIMGFAIGFAFYQSLVVGLILLIILPVNTWVIVMQLKSQRGVRVALIDSQEDIQATVVEMISGIEETRVANFENEQLKKIETIADGICEREFKHHKGMIKFDFTKGALKCFFHIVILAISIYMAFHKYITVGDVLTYSLLFMASIKPIEEIHRYLDELQENSIKANNLKEIFESYPVDSSFNTVKATDLNKAFVNAIEVNGLSFKYKCKSGNKLFTDLSFKIKQGEYVGVVGESGCGKSTLIKNILRLQEGIGEIQVHGVNLKNISRDELAKQVIYIPQNPFIFNGTIRDNMSFGCKRINITDAELFEAAKKSCLLEYIKAQENGLDSLITERGTNLSNGQCQRISLSRVFVNSDKPLVILDEATSAMDNQTEAKVYESLLSTGKTIVSIAHRLNTLIAADNIIVMNRDGKIVQQGTFNELINQPGVFSSLAAAGSESSISVMDPLQETDFNAN